MTETDMDRRRFIRTAVAAAAGGLAFGRTRTAARVGRIRLGGPVFVKTDDPEQLALEHRRLGYLAAYCPAIPLDDSARIAAIADAFRKQGVVIAEVGRWVNLFDRKPAARSANLKRVTEGLALAESVGALCCVDIAGSYNPTRWDGPHPDNVSDKFFDAAVENARAIIDAVKPKRAKFCYEMMGWSLPDSADSTLKMIRAVDREAFAVHLDPCNLINCPQRFYRNTDLLNECFDKLGPWIVSCHAKDLIWENGANIQFREVRPGAGALDYGTYLARLARLPHTPPLMLEHLSGAEEYDKGRQYILDRCKSDGISFE